jgi:hypothetical protein
MLPWDSTGIEKNALIVHEQSYGITSDPLTHFACVFSALIHDVDHTGVPNAQLIKENDNIAAMYHNKSVAEQISVDVAWNLLLEDRYSNLRAAIYTSKEELEREGGEKGKLNAKVASRILSSEQRCHMLYH